MTKKETYDCTGGFLLLVMVVITLAGLKGICSHNVPDRLICDRNVHLEVSGDIRRPGVYSFCRSPALDDLLARAGGFACKVKKASLSTGILYQSGAKLDVRRLGEIARVTETEMTGFYKITLGIPISINRETLEGLAALPGIGPGIAGAIVRERTKRGGFQKMDEILSVKGIGPRLYSRISPYVCL